MKGNEMKIILQIDGMMCPKCEAHMNEAVKSSFKVKKVESSHKLKQTVILTEADISDEDLAKVAEKAGYQILSVSRKQEPQKSLFSIFKR